MVDDDIGKHARVHGNDHQQKGKPADDVHGAFSEYGAERFLEGHIFKALEKRAAQNLT